MNLNCFIIFFCLISLTICFIDSINIFHFIFIFERFFFFINDKISNGIFFFLGKVAKIFFSWSKILKFSFIPLVDLRKLRNTLVNVLIVNFIIFFQLNERDNFQNIILFYIKKSKIAYNNRF